MTRDAPPTPAPLLPALPQPLTTLEALGWQPVFARQAAGVDLARTPPVRVVAVHRSGLQLRGAGLEAVIPPRADVTAGDWLLLDAAQPAQSVLLARKSLIQRKAPGDDRRQQLIAANVDSCFIVTSCNLEFNLARLERYLALAYEAGVTPVIVLTKADLCPDPAAYVSAARGVSDRADIIVLDARSDAPAAALGPWCAMGQTVAFLGSSGVGKSTLINALMGGKGRGLLPLPTAPVRDDDAKGRHTTRHRELHFLPDGGALMDMPGMRELQLADAEDGVEEVFSDLADLAAQCRFSDCKHQTEPGCAIRVAVKDGTLDPARLARWTKLALEEQVNSTAMARRKTGGKPPPKPSQATRHRPRK